MCESKVWFPDQHWNSPQCKTLHHWVEVMEHDDGESGFLIKTIQFNGSKLVLLSWVLNLLYLIWKRQYLSSKPGFKQINYKYMVWFNFIFVFFFLFQLVWLSSYCAKRDSLYGVWLKNTDTAWGNSGCHEGYTWKERRRKI